MTDMGGSEETRYDEQAPDFAGFTPWPEDIAERDEHELCRPLGKPDEPRFVAVFEADCTARPLDKAHRRVSLMSENDVSSLYDMDDQTGQAAELVVLLHVGVDGALAEVTRGAVIRLPSEEENPVHYAVQPLVLPGGQIVGYVSLTDH
jgi:hypothetical protein